MTAPDNDEKLRKIAQKLLEDTNARRIEWSETDDSDAFEYSLTNSSIVVNTNPRAAILNFWMTVMNSRAAVVGLLDVYEDQVDGPWEGSEINTDDFELVRRLWLAARDSALQIGKTLDSVMDELDGLIP